MFEQLRNPDLKGVFSISRIDEFLNNISCHKLSAPTSDKIDVILKLRDIYSGSPNIGFSIKSELGSPPTLLNASKATNFIYKIEHSCPTLLHETNQIVTVVRDKPHTDVKGRINHIMRRNGRLKYFATNNQGFSDNLVLIDSEMGKIISETLLYFYRDGIINCEDMVKRLEKENPMHYGNVNAYKYKFKKFLTAVALGMRPSVNWDGIEEASGGYIIVTKGGDVLAYHARNRNFLEEYLLNHTKYETASTSRHAFGEVYTDGKSDYINLNLQIRFK